MHDVRYLFFKPNEDLLKILEGSEIDTQGRFLKNWELTDRDTERWLVVLNDGEKNTTGFECEDCYTLNGIGMQVKYSPKNNGDFGDV
jgi:hypothetical protein